MSSAALRRQLVRSFSSLASGIPLFRPGSQLPGSAAPLLGAPPPQRRPMPPPAERSRLRTTLRLSVTEGMVAEVFTACAGATVMTAWALALKLSPFLVGLMTALPFFAQFVQFPSACLTQVLGARRVALVAVGLSRLVVLPLALLPWLPLSLEGQQHLLVAVAGGAALFGVVGNNAWVSWMGELVPSSVRGRYFGKRTALTTLAGTCMSLVAGLLLDSAKADGSVGAALPVLSAAACVVGLVTTALMARQHEPPREQPRVKVDLRAALLPLADARARRVLTYQVAWNAAVGLSAPFFAYHMLKNLKMTFVLMALHGAATAGVRILAAPVWGRLIDRVGAKPVLMACSLGIGVIPALWLFPTEQRLWPIGFDMLLAGAFWSGHGLAAFALPLSVAPRKGRPYYLAAFATAGGLAYAAASSLGGALAGWLPTHFVLAGSDWDNLHVLFALSSLARLGAAFLAARIAEPGAADVQGLRGLVALLLPRPLKPAPAVVRS